MKSMLTTLILTLSFATLLGACSESRHAPTPNSADTLGTGDSGGGNLYKGRPIESYSIDITQLPAYKAKIAPIVDALTNLGRSSGGKQLSNPDLGRMFQAIITKRTWFMIPGPLEGLPKERTGIVVPSEQGALQSAKEIWLDSDLFAPMNIEDQGNLLLHEVLMGLRILKFASDYDQCASFALNLQYCGNDTTPNGSIDQLTPQDYAEIRSTVIEIMKSYSDFTYADWDDLMARNNFSMSARDFKLKEDRGEISATEVIKNIKKAYITQKLPIYGYKTYPHQKLTNYQESCKIELVESQDENKFDLKLKTPTVDRTLHMDFTNTPTLTFYRYKTFTRNKLSQIPVAEFVDMNNVKVGDRHISTEILFDLDTWVGVIFKEMVVTEVNNTSGSKGYRTENLENGLFYFCYRDPSISISY